MVSLTWVFLVAITPVGGKIINCYDYSGNPHPNNTICPGSNTCCGAGATCLSSRLCHNPEDGPDTSVRGLCSINPYDSGTCAQICLYSKDLSPIFFGYTG